MVGMKTAPESAVTKEPANVDTAEYANPAALKTKKRFAKRAFDFAVGLGIGVGVRAGMVAAFGASLPVVFGGAAIYGAVMTGYERCKDVRAYNKNADSLGKAGFFEFEKTGHSKMHYAKVAGIRTGVSALGGVAGFYLADYFHAAIEKGVDAVKEFIHGAPVVVAPVPVPVDPNAALLKALEEQVGQLKQEVITLKQEVVKESTQINTLSDQVARNGAEISTLKEQVITLQHEVHPDPVVTEPVVTHPDPVVVQPDPVIVNPEPVVVPVHVPTLDERTAQLIAEAKSRMPHHMSHALKDALGRAGSASESIRAQGIKDLGYFFANGFARVTEDDSFANKLYELSLDISHGKNLQAAHDLGYQLLYGKGAAVDTARAYELLTRSSQGGHHISDPMLKYMRVNHLVPRVG